MKHTKKHYIIAFVAFAFVFLVGCAQKSEEEKAMDATQSTAKTSIDKAKALQDEAEKKAAELEAAAKQ